MHHSSAHTMLILDNECWESTIPFTFTNSKMISKTNRIVTVHRKSFQEHIFLWYMIMNNNTGRKPADTYCQKSNLALKKFHICCIHEVVCKLIAISLIKQAHFSGVCSRKPTKRITNSARIPLKRLQDFGLWCYQCKCVVSSWQKSDRLSNLLWHMRFSSDGPMQQSLWMEELSNVSSNASKDT